MEIGIIAFIVLVVILVRTKSVWAGIKFLLKLALWPILFGVIGFLILGVLGMVIGCILGVILTYTTSLKQSKNHPNNK